MKKILIIILIAFIATSILTITFTFQASDKFRNFADDDDDDDDNGDDDDSSLSILGLVMKREENATQISISIDQKNHYWKRNILNSKNLFNNKRYLKNI